jgi:phage protein D
MSNKYVEVSFPSADVPPLIVSSLYFYQERYKHEYAVVSFRDWNVAYDNIRPGSPVQVKLKNSTSSTDFYGYVHHTEQNRAPGLNYTDVHIIGASYMMKQPSQAVYLNSTADQIVTKIAKKHGFSYNAVPHPRVFPQISHAGLSDFDMLHKLAKQTGYSLTVKNTSIHYQPVTHQFNQNKINAPIFVMRDQAHPGGSTLYSFDVLIGESLDQNGEIKAATAIAGVDATSGKVFQVTNQQRPKSLRQKFQSELFDAFASRIVAPSVNAAKSEAAAVDERTKFAYQATVEVIGTPNLAPDQPIYLDGIGADFSGYWVIMSTEHKVESTSYTLQKYTTILTVGTDSLGKTVANGSISNGVNEPKLGVARTIIPGVRQTAQKPITNLQASLRTGSKNTSLTFGNVNNRPTSTNASQSVVASKWNSPSGNLNTVTQVVSRPAYVVKRLANNGKL